jgi:trehalose-phosphatase
MIPEFVSGVPSWTWRRVQAAPHRLLMCDYDGSLAPLRTERSEAAADPGTLRLLHAIALGRRTSIAIVSGRPVRELAPLLDAVPAWLVGEHGWEIRHPDGNDVLFDPGEEARSALMSAAGAAEARGWSRKLERKRTALVLHTRGMPADEAVELEHACARLWRTWRFSAGLRLTSCDGGIELKASGRDKGTAVLELLRSSPAGTYPVYLGDDETDEDAFRALRGEGLGIRIGPGRAFSLARGHIESQEGVAPFLEAWLLHVEGGSPTGASAP